MGDDETRINTSVYPEMENVNDRLKSFSYHHIHILFIYDETFSFRHFNISQYIYRRLPLCLISHLNINLYQLTLAMDTERRRAFTLKMEDYYNDRHKNTFIHFDDSEICNQFKAQYKGALGHTCCNGEGCLLLDVDNTERNKIEKEFLKKYETQKRLENIPLTPPDSPNHGDEYKNYPKKS